VHTTFSEESAACIFWVVAVETSKTLVSTYKTTQFHKLKERRPQSKLLLLKKLNVTALPVVTEESSMENSKQLIIQKRENIRYLCCI
jgi:hypothetical protein